MNSFLFLSLILIQKNKKIKIKNIYFYNKIKKKNLYILFSN